jgi:putative FmdB family regulatory protein
MPTYHYQCKACGHELEEFQSITEAPLTRCPNCETDNLARSIGTGAGLIFKGSGFYLTDYKKTSPPPSGESTGGTPREKPATSPTPPSPSSGGPPPPAKKE